jgi:hypothetical protein
LVGVPVAFEKLLRENELMPFLRIGASRILRSMAAGFRRRKKKETRMKRLAAMTMLKKGVRTRAGRGAVAVAYVIALV